MLDTCRTMWKYGQIRVTGCGEKRQDSPEPIDIKFRRTDFFLHFTSRGYEYHV